MKLFTALSVILVGLVSVELPMNLVESCGPYSHISVPFDFTKNNKTKELGYPPFLTILKEGARRGIEECHNQFNESAPWNCSFVNEIVDPELPIFVNTTLPYATRETAFIHAISSAGITYELTLRCRHNIRGCKCLAIVKPPWQVRSGTVTGCGDNYEFGQKQSRCFFKKLEKGNDARTAVNLHNNEVGREVIRTSLVTWCKCQRWEGACGIKACWKILAPFRDIGAELKQKYRNAVRVWFVNNKLHERSGNRFKVISNKDRRLVYLDPSSDYCVRNYTSGFPGMLGRTCTSNDVTNENCKSFIALCSSCNLKPQTEEHFKEVKCVCKRDRICLNNYFVTTCTSGDEM